MPLTEPWVAASGLRDEEEEEWDEKVSQGSKEGVQRA
jgi:hypothetical protein